MAKVVGLVGSASGKVGNVVYAVVNGIQTARVYQPNVANPKSSGQIAQRAKLALAGRLSKITPREALFGLGINARERRSAFMSNIIKAALYNNSKVTLAGENLVLSAGTLPLTSSSTYTVSTHSNYSDVDVSTLLTQVSSPQGYSVRIVVVIVDTINESNDMVQTLVQVPTSTTEATVTKFRFPLSTTQISGSQIFVYAIPQAPNPSVTGVGFSGVGGENREYVLETSLSNSIDMLYGSSVLLPLPA